MAIIEHQSTKPSSHQNILDEVRAKGRSRVVEPGSHLFQQADECRGLYLLDSGLIGLRKLNEDGTTMLVNLVRPGDFMGYGPLLADCDHLTSAEVIRPSRVVFIEIAQVRRMLREMPAFLSLLLKQAARDLNALEDKYLQMATRQAHVRLATLLLSLKDTASNEPSGCRFELPLMNKDIADLIGIRPETLSRAIGQLRSAGLAEMRDHVVHIPSIAKLASLGATHSAIAA
jgi:CRP-like cAMP-binding protein